MNSDSAQLQSASPELVALEYTGPVPQGPPPTIPTQTDVSGDITTTAVPLEDNWVRFFTEDFEGAFPQLGCSVSDRSLDGQTRYWSNDDYNPFPPSLRAGWPAKGGTNGVDPATNPYPTNLDSWLTCGPFDLSSSSTEKILVRFDRWLEINDPDDALFVGISYDGLNYTAVQWNGVNTNWRKMNVYFDGISGWPQVYVSWFFTSDNDGPTGQGPWIDNLELWRYNTPVDACGPVDPGIKGIVVDPYETVGTQTVPIIRSGDTQVVDGLLAADAGIVRMLFQHRNGVIQLQDYDRMFDTLCAQGINMLGVVNQESLVRQDYNVPGTAASYRQEFADTVDLLANHFEGRIYHWEIWNEQDLGPDNPDGPYIRPQLYAPLLVETYQELQQNSRPVSLLYGGLSSAWDRSHDDYFVPVYTQLDTLGAVGSNSPFDYLAIHPYLDPNPDEPEPKRYCSPQRRRVR